MRDIDYNEIIERLKFFRDKSNLSMRESSLRLGNNPQYIRSVENQEIFITLKKFLEILEIYEIDLFNFVNLGKKYNKINKEFLELFLNLSDENKKNIIELMKNLK